MDPTLAAQIDRITASGRVAPEDVLTLRPYLWRDGAIGKDEANAIFTINDAATKSCPQWVDLFVEAITHFVVSLADQPGHVDAGRALWLIDRIGKDGVMETRAELLLIVAILERAHSVDDALQSYILAQIERVVLTGKGPTRVGSQLRPGIVDEAELALLRRLFFAPASDGTTLISEDEARVLFRIKDATLGQANAPGWETLFVQLVGNHFMAHPPSCQPSPERMAELDAFMNDTVPNVGRFLARMEAAILKPAEVIDAVFGEEPATHYAETAVAASKAITTDEATWLKAAIAADGEMDMIEKALLAFIIDESGPLPVSVDQIAVNG